MLRAGSLTKRVTFQSLPTAPVGPGDISTAWADYLTTWARIRPLTGRELVAAGAEQNVGTHEVTVRYRADKPLSAAMRMVYGTRYFNIVSPPRNVDERGEYVMFEAEEGLANG
jgi:SPP1 family predicted phage head-tail adaptor